MQLDADARIESYEIVEGVIRSAARMTYTDVHAILEGDAETRSALRARSSRTSSACSGWPG